jgi:hypothetical protein
MIISIDEARARYPDSDTAKFGDNRELSNHLISLIRSGKKRATCGSLKAFEENEEKLPVVGRRDIVLSWDDIPELVIETTGLTIRRFCLGDWTELTEIRQQIFLIDDEWDQDRSRAVRLARLFLETYLPDGRALLEAIRTQSDGD